MEMDNLFEKNEFPAENQATPGLGVGTNESPTPARVTMTCRAHRSSFGSPGEATTRPLLK